MAGEFLPRAWGARRAVARALNSAPPRLGRRLNVLPSSARRRSSRAWVDAGAKRGFMTLSIRRVVTDHDQQGQSVVRFDEITSNIVSRRPGHSSTVIWSHAETPVDNTEERDGGLRDVADCAANGAIFRVVEYAPGVSSRMHRTVTVDYAVVMAGEIDMVLDGGKEVHLKQGDVLVQRGTVHDWINRGSVPCVIAFVLIAAKPAEIGEKSLGALG